MKHAYVWVVLAAFLCSYANAGTPAGPVTRLSLEEALDIAAQNSYQILLAQSRLREAQGRKLESWSGFLPHISISENYYESNDPVAVFGIKLRQGIFTQQDFSLPALNDPAEIKNYTTVFQFRQPLVNLDAIFGKSAAAHAQRARSFSLKRTEEAIALEVERAYYGLILSRRSLGAIEQAVLSAETYYGEVGEAYKNDLVSEADLLGAEVRLAELNEHRIVAKHQIANASDGLKFLLGMDDENMIEPSDSLECDPESVVIPRVDRAHETRSDLQALRYQNKAAERNLWMQRSRWIPHLNAFGSIEWHSSELFGDDGDNWSVGFQLEWNLFDGLGTWGRSRQASAQAAMADVQYREARARSMMEVRQAARALVAAKERVAVAETAVAQARESFRITRERFKEGLERPSDLFSREAAFTNARLRLLRAQYDLKISISELAFYRGAE
jgi:outer membrane protein TolC